MNQLSLLISTYTKLNNLKTTSLNIDFDIKYFFKYGP